MKILVLGHSDSDGSRLRDPALGWPWIVQRMIAEATGSEPAIVHKLLFAGPTAVGYMERQVEAEGPDVVIVGTSGYAVMVQLASNRVRRRFGPRAGDIVARAERQAARMSARFGPGGNPALTVGRRVARRVLGTSPAFGFEELTACYDDILDNLARRENVQTIIFGGLGYGPVLQKLNPRLNELQDELHRRLRVKAEEHHFDMVIHEELLGGREAKLAFMQGDGVHSNEAAQRIAAEAVAPLVLASR